MELVAGAIDPVDHLPVGRFGEIRWERDDPHDVPIRGAEAPLNVPRSLPIEERLASGDIATPASCASRRTAFHLPRPSLGRIVVVDCRARQRPLRSGPSEDDARFASPSAIRSPCGVALR